MPALIQLIGQLLSRILIAFFAWSFTFVGHGVDFKLYQASSTAPQLNTSPIFVEIKTENIDIAKNKITGTTTSTTPVAKKTEPVTPVKTNEAPSLKNIPVPNINFPQITEEINRGTSLGEWSNVYSNSKQSVVNIFCVSTKGNMVSISTGSGVIIKANGIILTNAHVAENFLIPNKDCSIRQGEIAMDKYKASLVYINENWLQRNAGVIFTQKARGTGENDFALLSINSKNDNTIFNSNIPYAKISTSELTEKNKGEQILIAGYPAGTLGTLSLRKYLNFVADVISISNVYTLDTTHVDVFETETTKVGQHGSSGGGVFDANNNLIGLIVSVSDESGDSKVNVLTTTYINRAIKNDTGKTLNEFTSTDKSILISSFLLKENSLFEYVKPFLQ